MSQFVRSFLHKTYLRPLVGSYAYSTISSPLQHLKNITVYGSGLMGAGISQVAAQKGYAVTMVDLDEKVLDRSINIIKASLHRVAKKQFEDNEIKQKELIDFTLSNIKTSTNSSESSKDADMIIEAIIEDIYQKQQLFGSLDEITPTKTIFVTTTSSLPIKEIAKVTKRVDRFAGLHFFNPVPQMKLVEVVRTGEINDETYETLMEFVKNLDKTPVACKDTPGFIVNRLLVPYLLEAIRLVDRGVADPRDVDMAMKSGAGMPMGPFELCDFIGLDTLKSIVDGWRKSGNIDPHIVAPTKMLDDHVKEGKLGRKTREGFFSY
ncbi:hypothetical protein Glove_564g58 [Diversispora epigaea]|uniref:3-hydroxyacyl-CoA dehydrogenase n=1 Tax=Diversispora epigaea TaxID=1348612 RepID=A0A397GE61_9GLOM|nr:hypothetical protein Glove_564g58 [Diversispora epigaea]